MTLLEETGEYGCSSCKGVLISELEGRRSKSLLVDEEHPGEKAIGETWNRRKDKIGQGYRNTESPKGWDQT